MEDVKALAPIFLVNYCNIRHFKFQTTTELLEPIEFIGQRRAFDAITFGISNKHNGYNLYALGPEDIGKHDIINSILRQEAANKPTPPDWCYVYNFKNPRFPRSIKLPAGVGLQLKRHMEELIQELNSTVPAIFETE